VVVLDADVSSSTLTFLCRSPSHALLQPGRDRSLDGRCQRRAGPERQDSVRNTYAAHLTLRACEQIRTCVAYANANVKLWGGYSGLSDYNDGRPTSP
jgi:hypothetical protein